MSLSTIAECTIVHVQICTDVHIYVQIFAYVQICANMWIYMYRYMQSINVWRKSYTVKVRKVQKLNCVPMFMTADLCVR